jgi:hypothetical protein
MAVSIHPRNAFVILSTPSALFVYYLSLYLLIHLSLSLSLSLLRVCVCHMRTRTIIGHLPRLTGRRKDALGRGNLMRVIWVMGVVSTPNFGGRQNTFRYPDKTLSCVYLFD